MGRQCDRVVRANYKSRGNECNSTPCHDSNEKKLQGPRHLRPAVRITVGTLISPSPSGDSPNVLEAS